MKVTFWDILTILIVLGLCLVVVLFAWVIANPYTFFNPFPPPTLPATIHVPSYTPTRLSLPATWTTVPKVNSPTVIVVTSTPIPSDTPPIIPTMTASLTLTPTPTITRTPSPDSAELIERLPPSGAVFSPGADFDMVLEVRNIGTTTWNTAYKFRYVSGAQFQEGSSTYSLKSNVAPGSKVRIIMDAVAPNSTGTHASTWELVNSSGDRFYLITFSIKVQ